MPHLLRPAALFLALVFAAPALAADAPSVTPVRAIVSNPLPADLDVTDRPYSDATFSLMFMVKGENLIGVKTTGIVVTTLTDGAGNDLATNRDGSPAWRAGGWPKVAKDGNHVFFDISFNPSNKKNLLGAMDGVSMDGTITLLTSPGARKVVRANLKVGDTFKEAGVEFSVVKNTGGSTSVVVKGFRQAISGDLTLSAGGKKLDSNGSFSGTDATDYGFAKATGPMTLEFAVWRDVKETTVPFHYGAKK